MKQIITLISVLLISINMFGQWEECSFPQADPTISDLIKYNDELYCASDSGIYKSSDNGQNWIRVFYDENVSIDYLVNSNNTLWGGGNGIYKSNNNGESWQKIFTLNLNVNGMSVDNNEILVGTDQHIYFSDNYGSSWTHITTTPYYNNNFVDGLLKVSENTYLCNVPGVAMYISYDNMATWTQTAYNYSKGYGGGWDYRFLKLSNGNIFRYINAFFDGNYNYILFSIDNGNSFTKVSVDNDYTTSLTEYNGNLFVTGFSQTSDYADLYVSYDDGLTWSFLEHIGDFSKPRMLKIYDGYLLATTSKKMYQKPLPQLAVNKIDDKQKLSCFPNPANEILTIKLNINKKDSFKLSIIDISGKEVYNITKMNVEDGNNECEINTQLLNNGIYFCKLQIGNNIYTKKILIK